MRRRGDCGVGWLLSGLRHCKRRCFRDGEGFESGGTDQRRDVICTEPHIVVDHTWGERTVQLELQFGEMAIGIGFAIAHPRDAFALPRNSDRGRVATPPDGQIHSDLPARKHEGGALHVQRAGRRNAQRRHGHTGTAVIGVHRRSCTRNAQRHQRGHPCRRERPAVHQRAFWYR